MLNTQNLVSSWEVTGTTWEGDRFYGSYRYRSDAEFTYSQHLRNGTLWCRTVHGKRTIEARKHRPTPSYAPLT